MEKPTRTKTNKDLTPRWNKAHRFSNKRTKISEKRQLFPNEPNLEKTTKTFLIYLMEMTLI
jgi:hypothetical protein